MKYAASGTADGTLVYSGGRFAGITPYGMGDPALQLLRALALMPPNGTVGMRSDLASLAVNDDYVLRRGGGFGDGANAGCVRTAGRLLEHLSRHERRSTGLCRAVINGRWIVPGAMFGLVSWCVVVRAVMAPVAGNA